MAALSLRILGADSLKRLVLANSTTISLIRHGKPTLSLGQAIRGTQVKQFFAGYDAAGIRADSVPAPATIACFRQAQTVYTSDLRRAVQSAQKLAPNKTIRQNPLFREIDCWSNFPIPLKLSALSWLVLTRYAWPLGYGTPAETLAIAKKRAQQAAQLLTQAAEEAGPVALVAHGGINTLIARELRRMDWQGPRQPQLSHWGCSTYCHSV